MSINIIAQFKAKPGRSQELIELMCKHLPHSLEQAGCEEVAVRQNLDEPDDVISEQRWTSRRHYDIYVASRSGFGMGEQIDELLSARMQVRCFNEVQLFTTVHAAATTQGPGKRHIVRREIPKISTADAPGG